MSEQSEIQSLAAEIVHAYEELHLLYELGEVLTTDLSVADVTNLVTDKILHALNADDARLHLGSSGASSPADDHHLNAALFHYLRRHVVADQRGGDTGLL